MNGGAFMHNEVVGYDDVSIKGDNLLAGNNRIKSAEAVRSDRDALLTRLANLYISSHEDLPPKVKAGQDLPPMDWLNVELDKLNADWRITSIRDGHRFTVQEVQPRR